MAIQSRFKTDDLSMFNHDYTKLIRFLMTHLPDLLRGWKAPGIGPQIKLRPRLSVERSLDYISPPRYITWSCVCVIIYGYGTTSVGSRQPCVPVPESCGYLMIGNNFNKGFVSMLVILKDTSESQWVNNLKQSSWNKHTSKMKQPIDDCIVLCCDECVRWCTAFCYRHLQLCHPNYTCFWILTPS